MIKQCIVCGKVVKSCKTGFKILSFLHCYVESLKETLFESPVYLSIKRGKQNFQSANLCNRTPKFYSSI